LADCASTPVRAPLGLGFHRADGYAIEIEQVVGEAEAGLHLELADGDAASGGEVQFLAALNQPASGRQVAVDFAVGLLFGGLRHANAMRVLPHKL